MRSKGPVLRARQRACTGYDVPVAERTPAQRRAFATLLAVTHEKEEDFGENFGSTIGMYKFVHQTADVRNPFDNMPAVYAGSPDDAALNRGVVRYRADPGA